MVLLDRLCDSDYGLFDRVLVQEFVDLVVEIVNGLSDVRLNPVMVRQDEFILAEKSHELEFLAQIADSIYRDFPEAVLFAVFHETFVSVTTNAIWDVLGISNLGVALG